MGKNPGYLTVGPGSNVEASSGGDPSVLSFYSTVASTAWTPKRIPRRFENNTEISTGFVKNFAHIQSPTRDDDGFTSTYKAVNENTMRRLRTAGMCMRCQVYS